MHFLQQLDGPQVTSSKTKKSGKHLKAVERYLRNPHKIIGIDGEGITVGEEHRFILLLASNIDGTSSSVETEGSTTLSTRACFELLLSLAQDALKISYSFGYDVNMMLGDLNWDLIQKLHSGEYIMWKQYRIRYIPRKMFWVSDGKRKCMIYDTFGFFQSRFVKALEDWEVGTKEEIAQIEAMKEQRAEFHAAMLHEMKIYCKNECVFICRMMVKLLKALSEAKLYPSHYSGAGALASYLLGYHQIKDFLVRDERIDHAALYGYYGGRFDLCKAGHFENTWSYDINSAYPAECVNLPCLAHGDWYETRSYNEEYKIAMWRISWEIPSNVIWTPFPWRDKDGSIYYTACGQGWYWSRELEQGIRLINLLGGRWRVDKGFVYKQLCDHHPFSWLPDFYLLRRKYQQDGNPAQKVMKLGYNSLYGKLAQTVGYTKDERGRLVPPPYQSWVWAGLVTSGCRANVLDATNHNPDVVISHATDGLISTARLHLPNEGEGLGEWKVQRDGELWLIQPGIYWFPNLPDKEVGEVKTRGHLAKEIDWNELVKAWKKDPFNGKYEYTTHRFIGMGTALWRDEFYPSWRTWQDIKMDIFFAPRRRMNITTKSSLKNNGYVVEWLPRTDLGRSMSSPYTHKDQWSDQYQTMRFEKLMKMEQP